MPPDATTARDEDLTPLVAPLPGTNPAGLPPIQFSGELTARRKRAIEGRPADESPVLPADSPARVKLWRDVLDCARALLAGEWKPREGAAPVGSKSLEAATRYADAATRIRGLPGAREGFALLRRLTEEAWDRLWPAIPEPEPDEPVDLNGRRNQYEWLDDPQGGGLFPNALRDVVLAEADGVAVSVNTYLPGEGRKPTVTQEQLQAVAARLKPEAVREAQEAAAAAVAELDALRQAVEARFAAAGAAADAPTFRDVRAALEDCRRVVDALTAAGPGDEPGGAAAATADAGAPAAEPAEPKGRPSRESLYRQLTVIADQLAKLEPHSPVPLLLHRVVELQNLPFPALVRQLTQDQQVLGFLERSLTGGDSSRSD